MTTYEVVKTELGECLLRNNEDGSVTAIPMDEANADYQRYLRWLENPEAEQSTPILSDEA